MKNSFIFSFFLSVVKRSYDVEITENTDWFSNIRQIDEEYHANVTNNVGSRASIQQGKCYLRVIHETFCDNLDLERIEMIRKGIQTGLRTHLLTHSLIGNHSLTQLLISFTSLLRFIAWSLCCHIWYHSENVKYFIPDDRENLHAVSGTGFTLLVVPTEHHRSYGGVQDTK